MIFMKLTKKSMRGTRNKLYILSINLTKAFNNVYNDGLCKALKKFDITDKMLNVITSFCQGLKAAVQSDGEFSDSF